MVGRDTPKAFSQSEKVTSCMSPESSDTGEATVSQGADTRLASAVHRMENTERVWQEVSQERTKPKVKLAKENRKPKCMPSAQKGSVYTDGHASLTHFFSSEDQTESL